jgi:hypothetical protein
VIVSVSTEAERCYKTWLLSFKQDFVRFEVLSAVTVPVVAFFGVVIFPLKMYMLFFYSRNKGLLTRGANFSTCSADGLLTFGAVDLGSQIKAFVSLPLFFSAVFGRI